jgi:hypothetical protein
MSDDIKKKIKRKRKKKKTIDSKSITEYYRKYRNTPKGKAAILRYRIKNWWTGLHAKCVSRHRNKVKLGIYTEEMDIDVKHLKELYTKQNEKCYWLGLTISVDNPPNHPFRPSIDRLDNNKGYTKSNIVITSLLANRARNTTSVEEWEVICNQLKITKGLISILDED